MPNHTMERPACVEEIASLQGMLRAAPTAGHRWKQGAENALVLWGASMLALVVVWLALSWMASKIFDTAFGLHTDATLWVLGIGVPVCGAHALASSVRWVKGWPDDRPLLRSDIEQGRVVEEHYSFTEVRRFQEPEHGGLVYFLRASSGQVLTLFDPGSRALGVQEDDPLKSSWVPRVDLVMVHAPHSGFVLSKKFSGKALDAGEPIALSVDPKHWPESEAYCSIPWEELEARLNPKASTAFTCAT